MVQNRITILKNTYLLNTSNDGFVFLQMPILNLKTGYWCSFNFQMTT